MTIGHKAYCLYCGTDLSRSGRDWLQCSRHMRRMVCSKCGKKLNDDIPYHVVGDALYCGDCVFYCAVHDRYEDASKLYGTILMSDGEKQVCRDGMERLAQCENCGVYGFKSKMLQTASGHSCKKHVRRYKKCAWCGKYVPNKEVHTDDNGNHFCQDCNDVLNGSLKFRLIEKEQYSVGDYVVMGHDFSNCAFGLTYEMKRDYIGRIVQIRDVSFDPFRDVRRYRVTPINGENWAWSEDCFRCAIVGVDDRFVCKTFDEVRHMMKGE